MLKVIKLLTLCSFFLSVMSLNAGNIPGPFQAEGLAFYLVHDGGPLTCSIKVDTRNAKDAKVFCRFLDAEEISVNKTLLHIPAGESKTASFDYGPNAPKGIYQVKISGLNYLVTLSSQPEKPFGVMPMRCALFCTSKKQFSKAFFMIPANADELTLQQWGKKPVTLTDSNGKEYAIASNKVFKHKVNDEHGKIWQLSVQGHTRLAMGGMPWILCGDAETAKAINGSIEQSSDGKYFAHKYQVKMHEWMQSLTDEELKVKPYDPLKYAKAFKNDPYSGWLLGGWGLMTHIDQIIKRQILDRKIGVNKFGHAQYGESPNPTALAAVYMLNRPFNPYYKDPAIARRMFLADFRVLLCLKENDTLHNSSSNYSGGDAICWAGVCRSFGYTGAMLKGDPMWKHWHEGMTRIVDRFPMFRVSCENQSSHWPYIFLMVGQGSGNTVYRQLAKEYIAGLCLPGKNPFLKTGYQQEAYGPDATYQGLGTCYQAIYYLKTGDKNAKNALATIYNLFNHTVAPEPDGTVFGCSSFSHRTAGSWVNRQYNGGAYLLAGALPEAAAWCRKGITPTQAASMLKQLPYPVINYTEKPQIMKYTTAVFTGFENYLLGAVKCLPDQKFPVEISENFTRNFNNEFLAIRRPDYYALCYLGKTSLRNQSALPKTPVNKKAVYKWTETQGLAMLWFPDYGNWLLAMNWNGDTGHFLRADLPDGKVAYPDYWSLKKRFEHETLTLDQKMFQLPGVELNREIKFAQTGVHVTLRCKFTRDITVDSLYEQLPFLKNKKILIVEFLHKGVWTSKPGVASAIRFNKQIEIKLDRPVHCEFGPDSKYRKQKMGSLRLMLGYEFAKDSTINVGYEVRKLK